MKVETTSEYVGMVEYWVHINLIKQAGDPVFIENIVGLRRLALIQKDMVVRASRAEDTTKFILRLYRENDSPSDEDYQRAEDHLKELFHTKHTAHNRLGIDNQNTAS